MSRAGKISAGAAISTNATKGELAQSRAEVMAFADDPVSLLVSVINMHMVAKSAISKGIFMKSVKVARSKGKLKTLGGPKIDDEATNRLNAVESLVTRSHR
jgi:hypothetical protein